MTFWEERGTLHAGQPELAGDPAAREGVMGVVSGMNISRNVLKASRRAKRARLGNEVYLQVTRRTENVLSEKASLIEKHANLANLVLLIKTPSADGDDPGLEKLNWKIAVCSPDLIEYVLLSNCTFEILPIFISVSFFNPRLLLVSFDLMINYPNNTLDHHKKTPSIFSPLNSLLHSLCFLRRLLLSFIFNKIE